MNSISRKKRKKLSLLILMGLLCTLFLAPTTYAANQIFKEGPLSYTINTSKQTAMVTGYDGSIGNVTIPDEVIFNGEHYPVTQIAISPFHKKQNLTHIQFGKNVAIIDEMAFYGTGLVSVSLGENLTTIGSKAFEGCTQLKSINLPVNVANIGDSAFSLCDQLEAINVDTNNSRYYSVDGVLMDRTGTSQKSGDTLVQFPAGKSASSYTIPNGILHIGDKAFYNCDHVNHIVIPSGVQSMGTDAFMYCSGLGSVDFGNTISQIGSRSFYQCESLKQIEIPDSVTYIGDSAFTNCTSLTSYQWGKNLTSITSNAFSGCTSLSNIDLPTQVTVIKKSAFNNCDALTQITIPNNIKTIEDMAFQDCEKLYEVQFGSGVDKIGRSAFYLCKNLLTVTLPENLKSIDSAAFANCTHLKSATILNASAAIASDNRAGGGSMSDAFYNTPVTLYGYNGSSTETYAKVNDVPFVSIGDAPTPQPQNTQPQQSNQAQQPTPTQQVNQPQQPQQPTPAQQPNQPQQPAPAQQPNQIQQTQSNETTYDLSGYKLKQMQYFDGAISSGSTGLVLKGGTFTNGRVVDGRVDGNAVQTVEKYNLMNTKIYGSYAIFGEQYANYIGLGIEGLPSGASVSTHHSFAGSYVVPNGTVLYKVITLTDSTYDVKLTTNSYYGRENAKLVYEQNGVFNETEKQTIQSKLSLFFNFGDNYGSDSNYMELYVLYVEPLKTVSSNVQKQTEVPVSNNIPKQTEVPVSNNLPKQTEVPVNNNLPKQTNVPVTHPVNTSTSIQTASPWAVSILEEAIQQGIKTEKMITTDFSANATREEFSELVITMYENFGGFVNNGNNPFDDTTNTSVIKAYNAGIISGTGNRTFSPQESITREQLCVMIAKSLDASGRYYNANIDFQKNYADKDAISTWAEKSIRVLNGYGIINGSGDALNPKGKVTKEMAMIMVYNAYKQFERNKPIPVSQNNVFDSNTFHLDQKGPIYLKVGDVIEIKAVIPAESDRFYPRWGISNPAIAEMSGTVMSGYSSVSNVTGIQEKFIITYEKSVTIKGLTPGTVTLRSSIGEYATLNNPKPKTDSAEMLIYVVE
ncbi:leucine-rich repeat protein [Fusibacter ferrireducens]|uniref:Leucine-rich repeat protein n=1 Tax=Fusibacter ferrireducens TaxID=2785058 RepID=A0ABR9ZWV4_9FIRM|nr:leucine-rich repeat protein [Fusibacter ferrireducens]MBF4694937.1 leucine-rich repeat protein [Fusibacter ferrireducens]